jgi:S-(hydroxymethyl)glutathione dehydrogenase/alcohol dehydrogenase
MKGTARQRVREMPKNTTAAILVKQNDALVVDRVELPENLGVGQVLVEFDFSGLCGSQLGEIQGTKGFDPWLPHLLGHEGVGFVLKVGPGVTRFIPGDRVVAHWLPTTGISSECPRYAWKSRRVNAGLVTTFNRHGVISENRLTILPDWIPNELGPLFGCALPTAFGTVENIANVRIGSSVLIMGVGGVGLNMIQACQLRGAKDIIVFDLIDSRLSLASKLGATLCINTTCGDSFAAVNNALGGRSLDCIIDNTGNTSLIEAAFKAVDSRGRVVLVGVPRHDHDVCIHSLDLHFGKTIVGTAGGEFKPEDDFSRLFSVAEVMRDSLKALVTEVATLKEINDLIYFLKSGVSSGRCLIDLRNS